MGSFKPLFQIPWDCCTATDAQRRRTSAGQGGKEAHQWYMFHRHLSVGRWDEHVPTSMQTDGHLHSPATVDKSFSNRGGGLLP